MSQENVILKRVIIFQPPCVFSEVDPDQNRKLLIQLTLIEAYRSDTVPHTGHGLLYLGQAGTFYTECLCVSLF